MSKTPIIQKKDTNRIIVPTGDGYVIGFSDSSEKPLRLAIDLLKQVEKYNQTIKGKEKLFLRIGIDTGPVYPIQDLLTGKKAFWGPGIIMAKRVMDKAAENQIFVSKDIAEKMKKLSREYKNLFHSIGEYIVKHDEKIEIYNVYGKGFGNKFASRKGKVLKKTETEKDLLPSKAIEFRNIEIILEIKDPKTMMTHHTWIWDYVNTLPSSQDQIHYKLEGDTPKEFGDLQVKITDKNENKLPIVSLNVNKPQEKVFDVQLKNPVKPRQRNRNLKLEYDWEEPERNFYFKPANDCKLSYRLFIPKGIEIKNQRVLKIQPDLGYKWVDKTPPKITFRKEKTEIFWQKNNVDSNFAYQLEW